jgi:rhodanese-related sulfurtransferase
MLSRVMRTVVGSREVSDIEPDEVAALLEDGEVVVVDNNPEGRWASGHIPGAINLDPADYRREDLPGASEDTPLVFYCKSFGCGASHYAAKRAVGMGFRRVHVMPAGIAGWVAHGLPVERAERGRSARR